MSAQVIAIDEQPPEGYRWEWVADEDWQVLPEGDSRKCRFKGCCENAVAKLQRLHRKAGFAWWPYCGQHLYGRKIENAVVMFRRLVPVGAA